jgi:plastocyanin
MRVAALLLALGALAVAGCGGDDDGSDTAQESGSGAATEPESSGEQPSGTTVDMNDQLAFEPREITVASGETVTWTNVGKVAHTVTADKSKAADPSNVARPPGVDPFDSGFITEGESFSRKFDKPGTYRYFCIPHEGVGMVGTVVVE